MLGETKAEYIKRRLGEAIDGLDQSSLHEISGFNVWLIIYSWGWGPRCVKTEEIKIYADTLTHTPSFVYWTRKRFTLLFTQLKKYLPTLKFRSYIKYEKNNL